MIVGKGKHRISLVDLLNWKHLDLCFRISLCRLPCEDGLEVRYLIVGNWIFLQDHMKECEREV